MPEENLHSAKNLFFTALLIDIVVTVIVVISAIWTIGVLKDIQSGQVAVTESLVGTVGFWENFSKLTIVTVIGVGLALVKWLDACYRYAKELIGASGFKNERWTAIAWIIPIFNTFKPYQIINEIYKSGSSGYRDADGWKKESGSGILLTWWIFWAVTHFIQWFVIKQILRKSLNSDLTSNQLTDLYGLHIGLCVFSIIVAVMWFFIVNHLTGRLLARQRVSDDGMSKSSAVPATPNYVGITATTQRHAPDPVDAAISKAASHAHTPPVSESHMQSPQHATQAITELSNEEDHWATAMEELETGQRRPGLWGKAFAESEGDETKAKVAYLKARVQQLADAEKIQDALKVKAAQLEKQQLLDDAYESQVMENVKKFESGMELNPDDVIQLVKEVNSHSYLVQLKDQKNGYTLLHWCARLGLDQSAEALLSLGASAAAKDFEGKQAHQLSRGTKLAMVLAEAAKTP